MTALGKPLGPDRSPTHRRHAAGGGLALGRTGLERSAPQPPRRVAAGHPGGNSAGHHFPENSQNGQTGLPAGRVATAAGVTKRQRIEAYLDRLSSEQLQNLTVREITADLQVKAWRSPSATSNTSWTSGGPHPRPGGGGVAPAAPADDRARTAPAIDQGPAPTGA